MPDVCELRVSLYRGGDETAFDIFLQYAEAGDASERRALRRTIRLPLETLITLRLNPDEYGKLLSDSVFADPDVRQEFETACAVTERADTALRLRLDIDPNAARLHGLLWETLRDPRAQAGGRWLATSTGVYFSRFLGSTDWKPVRLRPKAEQAARALIVIANPTDLARHGMAEIAVEAELKKARFALRGAACDELVSVPGGPERVTLGAIDERLRHRGYDFFYLVCHGSLPSVANGPEVVGRREPLLWLEGADGKTEVVSGVALADRFYDLPHPPRVVVLASCHSGGDGSGRTADNGVMAALGPRLSECGAPAVLAMQGEVTQKTAGTFLEEFFQDLNQHGQIDRAAATARRAVREEPDAWAPVLFTRFRGGTIWYVAGLHTGPGRRAFDLWPSLTSRIYKKQCLPVLGFGLHDLLRPPRDVARHLAGTFGFPMAAHQQNELAQVAQFLRVHLRDSDFPIDRWRDYLREQLLTHPEVPPALDEGDRGELDRLVQAIWDGRAGNPDDPHRVLAHLPCPIYLTATPDRLLLHALRDANKAPRPVRCEWGQKVLAIDPEPSVAEPLVCHLYGEFDDPRSLVLTEDDCFDFLIKFTTDYQAIPPEVRHALASWAVMFVGFDIDDWTFRVLFRCLMWREKREERPRVAAHLTPDDRLDPNRARDYLERYFLRTDVSLFWGTAGEFFRELRAQWRANARYAKEHPL